MLRGWKQMAKYTRFVIFGRGRLLARRERRLAAGGEIETGRGQTGRIEGDGLAQQTKKAKRKLEQKLKTRLQTSEQLQHRERKTGLILRASLMAHAGFTPDSSGLWPDLP